MLDADVIGFQALEDVIQFAYSGEVPPFAPQRMQAFRTLAIFLRDLMQPGDEGVAEMGDGGVAEIGDGGVAGMGDGAAGAA